MDDLDVRLLGGRFCWIWRFSNGKVMAVLVVLERGLALAVVVLMSFGTSTSFQSKSHDTRFVTKKKDLNRLKCET